MCTYAYILIFAEDRSASHGDVIMFVCSAVKKFLYKVIYTLSILVKLDVCCLFICFSQTKCVLIVASITKHFNWYHCVAIVVTKIIYVAVAYVGATFSDNSTSWSPG